MIRLIGILALIAGLVLTFVLPIAEDRTTFFEIGTYRVFDGAEFEPVTVDLKPVDAPVEPELVVHRAATSADSDILNLTIVANGPSGTALAEVLTIDGTKVRQRDTITIRSSKIEDLEEGPYTFTVGLGDIQELEFTAVDLKLLGRAAGQTTEYQPLGYIMLGLGMVMFLFGKRRRPVEQTITGNAPIGTASRTSQIGRAAPPPAEKPKQPSRKWGRDGGGD